ncbi:uncharacterized protein EV420DRAFT_335633 [Desarmillaria tabescens]|uniref:F-box domain-containing protein n=1 Tax=Armillaria tabescens TaxID=1929756 RepID=A0AA39N5P3_ARMTA|nr:uncharacterized protein EV420DRAFT_335633 [Desarmillaria tabescens]KAK0458852.1 hypothetical protein EV420DRAFT_335633 [Desarmillaria tabescens]
MDSIPRCDNFDQLSDTQPLALPLDAAAYLRYGRQLDKSETELCSDIIIGLKKKISQSDAEISRLNTALEKLKTGRQSLTSYMKKFESLLSPIRRLPCDVLQDIFEFVCTSISYDAFLSRDGMPLVSTTPFYLSSVCAYWRDVCLSFPPLWKSILVNVGSHDTPPQFQNIMKLYEQRSGEHLLNLQMSVELCKGTKAQRSGFNSVQRDLGSAMDTLFEFPELENLEFSAAAGLSFSVQPPVKLFEYAPKIHTLAVNTFQGSCFRLPDEQITTIYFANIPSFAYPTRSYDFPNATTATFRGCGYLTFGDVEFPFQRLILQDSLPVFHWMGSMPQLASLELIDIDCTNSSESDDMKNTICDLEKYISKSPLLTELVLNALTIGHPEMLSLLHAVPQLRRLSIVEGIDTRIRVVFPKLIKELGDAEVLQELEHLQLVWSGEVDESAILDILEKRVLKSAAIGVRKGGELRPDTLSRVDALRKSGTQVALW